MKHAGEGPSDLVIRQALSRVFSGDLLTQAMSSLTNSGLCGAHVSGPVDGADVDLQRASRCGFPEVIFGDGKPTRVILKIIEVQQRAGQSSLVTRLRSGQARKIVAKLEQAVWNKVARTIRVPATETPAGSDAGRVCVVTAGSSDRSIAQEALETLKWMQVDCELMEDCGVAGPHRLQKYISTLQSAAAIVCVAGMEAALPSVIGGYVSCPVIGVPTSIGYGASLQGLTAMMSMLTCCASNVVTVNIDAGFKGGYVAGLIASRAAGRR
jgi:pyridinium-3,5-biscarboxylic acid mononucleotide synthase